MERGLSGYAPNRQTVGTESDSRFLYMAQYLLHPVVENGSTRVSVVLSGFYF